MNFTVKYFIYDFAITLFLVMSRRNVYAYPIPIQQPTRANHHHDSAIACPTGGPFLKMDAISPKEMPNNIPPIPPIPSHLRNKVIMVICVYAIKKNEFVKKQRSCLRASRQLLHIFAS